MSRLFTRRLVIRPIERADLGSLVAWYSDPELIRHIGDGRAYSERETELALVAHIEQTARDGFGLMLAERRDDGVPIGRVGYKQWDLDGEPQLEIGWLVAAEHQGMGYATEAGIAIRDHGFRHLDRTELVSLIQHDNTVSRRVAEKVGGCWWRDWTTPGGSDVVVYRYARDRFRSGHGDVDHDG
ncbi:MAG: GNAT family N-acetyltransferase [Acidimicrobiia bacterium]